MQIGDNVEFPGPFGGSSQGEICAFPKPGRVKVRGGVVDGGITVQVPSNRLTPKPGGGYRYRPPWED